MSFWKVTLTCCVLLAAQTAGAQDWKGRGRLAGEVKTEDGTPLPGASVKLFRPKFEDGTTLTTDKKGRWAYLGLTGGPWNIDISAEGYVPRQLSVSVSEARRTPPIKVTLEVYVPPGPPPEVKEAIEKGDAAYEAGRYSEAREHYEKLLVLTPELGKDLHMQLARCYKQEGNYEKELEQLQAVVDLDPDNMEVRTLMALEAFEGGLAERGIELLAAIDEAAISNPDVFYNIGVAFRNRQDSERARTYFDKAVQIDTNYVDGYFQRGLTCLTIKDYAAAKADFEKVVALSPDGPQAEIARKALEELG